MEKLYRETFDEVRASGRLRTEVWNMREQERTKRRMPKAALIAAVLVLALAGTAVAAESLGWVKLESVEDAGGNGPGYHVRGDVDLLPLESLSRELLDEPKEEQEEGLYTFDSWSDMEEFLGLELADNPRLEQMDRRNVGVMPYGGSTVYAPCILSVQYLNKEPGMLCIRASYAENCFYCFNISALLYTEAFGADPRQDFSQAGYYGAGDTVEEEYVTPNGLEATIATVDWKRWGNNSYQGIRAYFLKNNAQFCVSVSLGSTDQDPDTAMELMKEILDGYE